MRHPPTLPILISVLKDRYPERAGYRVSQSWGSVILTAGRVAGVTITPGRRTLVTPHVPNLSVLLPLLALAYYLAGPVSLAVAIVLWCAMYWPAGRQLADDVSEVIERDLGCLVS